MSEDSSSGASPSSKHLQRVKRILVAFDRSHRGRMAAQTAVQLAALLEAELAGLFVEDENLLRAADLPFTHELGTFSRRPRPISRSSMEQSMRQEAREMEELLRFLAAPQSVKFTFRVSRGLVPSELDRYRFPDDVIVIGKTARLRHAFAHGIERSRNISRPSATERRGKKRQVPVSIFFDGQESSHNALQVALNLARETASPLLVITPPDVLVPSLPEMSQTRIEHAVATDLLHVLSEGMTHHSSMLVLPDGGRLAEPAFIALLANELEIPVLLV